MLLTITNRSQPADALGHLLHKHPERQQTFPLSFGQAHVFYPQVSDDCCQCAMVVQLDTSALVRRGFEGLEHYVNDRAYVASSFFSVALVTVFRDALAGKCKKYPELAERELDLEVRVCVVPGSSAEWIAQLFEPLGYAVQAESIPLAPELGWTEARYFRLTLSAHCRLSQILSHLYVLLPVLDDDKHYYVADDELEKLLRHGEGWLEQHPLKALITSRYLKHQKALTREALARLVDQADQVEAARVVDDSAEEALEVKVGLHEQRLERVVEILRGAGARRVLDLGCGSGKLLRLLRKQPAFREIVGMDVSLAGLRGARNRLKLTPEESRVQLLHGSLLYRDRRLEDFDEAALVEVIEHLEPSRLSALERNVFEFAAPRHVVVTTPNQEYNALFPNLSAGKFRHHDHRFEWTRDEFRRWANGLAERYGYRVVFEDIGPVDPDLGAPSQLAHFCKEAA